MADGFHHGVHVNELLSGKDIADIANTKIVIKFKPSNNNYIYIVKKTSTVGTLVSVTETIGENVTEQFIDKVYIPNLTSFFFALFNEANYGKTHCKLGLNPREKKQPATLWISQYEADEVKDHFL